ncbi:hypothetical protein ACLB2K_048387 [Fragaria x ananassa]
MALNFVGGIPFQILYDGVKLGIRKSRKFRIQLINLQITLDGLQPFIIQGIEDNNVRLHLPTETIRGLRTQMEEGKELVDMVLKLSMWNIRIWGNCYNCIGPDLAEKLSELDGSLRALIARLEMEAKKNITKLMILETANKDRLDRLDKKVELLLDGHQRMIDLMREQNEAIGRTVWSNSVQQVASSSGGGGATPAPALGVVFQQLFDIAMEVNVKNMMFRRVIERFKPTLHCLQPLIEEIAKYNRILHLPKEEVKNLIKQLKNGAELVRKCSKIRKRANYKKNEYITKILSLNNSLQRLIIRLKVQVEKSVKETSDSADKIEAVIKNIEAGGVEQIDDLGGKGHSPVEPGSPAVIRDVPQVNMEVSRDVIKEALVDSAKILIDQKGVKSNERSDVVQDQMETAAGLDVLSLQGSMDVETLHSTLVDSALKCETNIDKMGIDKNEGSGESPIEITVAAETEPPSPTVRDVPRNVKIKATAEPHRSSPAKVKQPDKEEETVLEHLKSRANARMTLLKKWFGRNNSCGKRNKGNVVLWIIPSNCNKESKVSTFCSCIKPFQKHSEETEMIMQMPFPYECIDSIISLTTPADACRLSLVSTRFKCAAESDQVWEKFLPSPHLIHAIESQSTSSSTFVPAKSKKEFYLALCDKSVLMDNGKMSFSLDKWSGKKCYMICARELNIVWAQDKSRYWSWISLAESRFKEVASLDEVCWLEIRGKIDMSILSPWTLYKAYLVYKLTKRHYGFNVPVEVAIAERHYGFEYGPLDAALGGDENKQTVYLDPSLKIMDGARRPNERADGWLEMELGEFLCQAEEDGELEMMCAEYKDLCWKSGLIVQGIEVRPEIKEYSEAKGKAGYFRAKGKKALFF